MKRRHGLTGTFGLLLLAPALVAADGAGCSGGGADAAPDASCIDVRASSYDRSCSAEADCVLVYEGLLCRGPIDQFACFCPSAGISRLALPRYYGDQAEAGVMAGGACSCGTIGVLRCVSGECLVLSPSADGGSE